MKREVTGLDRFGLTPAGLRRLGRRPVRVQVSLRSFDVTPRVAQLAPSERHPFLRRQASRWVASLFARYPVAGWKTESARDIPMSLEGDVPAAEVETLSRAAGVRLVHVASIPGCKAQRRPPRKLEWYCVRALVAIQIESERRGMQSVEDRFVLVRATSFNDAERRLAKEWREYATPYLNSDGQLVRWQLEKVTDVFQTLETELDPRGVEVYSKLRARRMRPEFVWRGLRRGRITMK